MASEKLTNLGNMAKRAIGIEGKTKETLFPMMAYSVSHIGDAGSVQAMNTHMKPFMIYIVGLSEGQYSFLLFLRSIWDAIIDPFIGFFADRTRSRFGKHRIYIIISAVPYGLAFLMRWDPFGMVKNSSVSKIMWYYFFALFFYATFESLYSITHKSMLPAIAPGYFERTQYTSMTYIFNGIGQAPAQVISSAIVGIRVTQEYTEALHPTILKLMIPMSIVLTVTILICGITTKQPSSKNEVFPEADMFLFFRQLRQIFRNKAFRQCFMMSFLYLFGSSFTGNSSIHFLKLVANRWDMRSQLQLAAGMEAAAFIPNYILTKKYGKQKCAEITTPLLFASILLSLVIKSKDKTSVPGLMTAFLFMREIFNVVGYSGFGFTTSNIFPDVTDVDEMITGQRNESMITAFRSFITTMTGGVMTYIVGMILEWFGVTDTTAQEPHFTARSYNIHPSLTTTFGLRLSTGVIPFIFTFFAIRQLRKYKMTKQDHELLQKVIKDKKENGFAEASADEKAVLESIAGQKWDDMWIGTANAAGVREQEAGAGN
ncbi:MAG: MFS transporter [Oscillospiraceae bacterium]|nr:MFS transporter [Oscillospiraceae bacterium]